MPHGGSLELFGPLNRSSLSTRVAGSPRVHSRLASVWGLPSAEASQRLPAGPSLQPLPRSARPGGGKHCHCLPAGWLAGGHGSAGAADGRWPRVRRWALPAGRHGHDSCRQQPQRGAGGQDRRVRLATPATRLRRWHGASQHALPAACLPIRYALRRLPLHPSAVTTQRPVCTS